MLTNDHDVAAEVATEAGRLLVQLRSELLDAGAHHWTLKDEGDRRSQQLIAQRLNELRPDDAILSEEAPDDVRRTQADRVWIVDPLDGTREYGEPPRTDWAVHVALWCQGELTAGAVALPGHDLTLTTVPRPDRIPPADGPPRVIASRTRPGPAAMILVDALDGVMLHLGSAGAKAMAVVLGEADIYAHTGGQYEWDSAAPAAVAAAAGLHVSRIDGSPLVYNKADPWQPDLLICRPELARPCLQALGF